MLARIASATAAGRVAPPTKSEVFLNGADPEPTLLHAARCGLRVSFGMSAQSGNRPSAGLLKPAPEVERQRRGSQARRGAKPGERPSAQAGDHGSQHREQRDAEAPADATGDHELHEARRGLHDEQGSDKAGDTIKHGRARALSHGADRPTRTSVGQRRLTTR